MPYSPQKEFQCHPTRVPEQYLGQLLLGYSIMCLLNIFFEQYFVQNVAPRDYNHITRCTPQMT